MEAVVAVSDSSVWVSGFADAWRADGVAYKLVKNNEIDYFKHLAETLEKQTSNLERARLNNTDVS